MFVHLVFFLLTSLPLATCESTSALSVLRRQTPCLSGWQAYSEAYLQSRPRPHLSASVPIILISANRIDAVGQMQLKGLCLIDWETRDLFGRFKSSVVLYFGHW